MRKALLIIIASALVSTGLRASTPGAVLESWKYEPKTKTLSLKMVNTSNKDITAYNIVFTLKYVDGTTNALSNGSLSSERGYEELGAFILSQMGSTQLQNAHAFAAGSTRYDKLPQTK